MGLPKGYKMSKERKDRISIGRKAWCTKCDQPWDIEKPCSKEVK